MNRMLIRLSACAAIAIVAAPLASCTSGNGGEKTQVVARVNDSEITVSQLSAALLAKGEAQPTARAAQQALEGLVNEQLLVDAALRSKLDRDPAVVQAIEGARRQLLARAYLERTVFPKQEISAADQAAYYKSHPALFAQRRVYQVTAYTCPSTQLQEDIVVELDGASSADGVAAVLAAHHIDCETQTLTRAAEQLPLEQLPQFSSAESGDVIIQPSQDERTTLMSITGIQSSPIGFESAQPIIQQYLVNVRKAEALDTHLKEARAAASITHVDASLLAASDAEPSTAPATDTESSRQERGAAVLN